MQKFFIDAIPPSETYFRLDGENFDHLKVLRPRIGDEIVLCDGCGTDYFCRIDAISKNEADLNILYSLPSVSEPRVQCHLFVAASKSDKLEHVIQKATEIGAVSITAFISDRCISRPSDKDVDKKLVRWQKIAQSAAGQCGRGIIPKVSFLPDLKAAVNAALSSQVPVLLYENEEENSLKTALSKASFDSVSIISGPEGGFSTAEAEYMTQSGLLSCSLGKRILRCETAPLCALSAILYHSGDI